MPSFPVTATRWSDGDGDTSDDDEGGAVGLFSEPGEEPGEIVDAATDSDAEGEEGEMKALGPPPPQTFSRGMAEEIVNARPLCAGLDADARRVLLEHEPAPREDARRRAAHAARRGDPPAEWALWRDDESEGDRC